LVRRAIVLDPLNALERGWLGQICWSWPPKGSRNKLEKGLNLIPVFLITVNFGLSIPGSGTRSGCFAEIEREPDASLRLQGYAIVYYALGRKKESDTALSELIAKYQTDDAFQIAEVYAFRTNPTKRFSG